MSALAEQSDDGWDGLLDDDEPIIWQGRPDGRFVFKPQMIFLTLFGLFFAGFALFWMIGAAQAGGVFWMFGLLHFSVGIGIVASSIFGSTFLRRRTWYTLTDRRAFIARKLPFLGRSLKSYPITKDTVVEYRDAKRPSVMFASEQKRGKNGTREVPVGFEHIADARSVLQMIRNIQKDA